MSKGKGDYLFGFLDLTVCLREVLKSRGLHLRPSLPDIHLSSHLLADALLLFCQLLGRNRMVLDP